MSGYQTTMVPGQVEYKRKYTLWVLVLLIIICWPAAIIYYFTRDKVPVQEFQTYAAPVQNPQYAAPAQAQGGRFCQACGAPNNPGATFCARCGKPIG